MNAVVASGITAADFARPFDTVWIDLSKGLGCPVGGVLAGSADLIAEAWVWKQRLGGALRQAGIVAAAGLYALDRNVERLAEDHANAKAFAEAIAEVPGLALDPATVETNLVYFDVTAPGLDAVALSARLLERGVDISAMGKYRMRAVTYLDVGRDEVLTAAAVVSEVMQELAAPAARDAG
jgi:threonine aldolase